MKIDSNSQESKASTIKTLAFQAEVLWQWKTKPDYEEIFVDHISEQGFILKVHK